MVPLSSHSDPALERVAHRVADRHVAPEGRLHQAVMQRALQATGVRRRVHEQLRAATASIRSAPAFDERTFSQRGMSTGSLTLPVVLVTSG